MSRWRLAGTLCWALSSASIGGPPAVAREITFDERVRAAEAIERVRYAHRTGADKPFEKAHDRVDFERLVRRYLEQSAALDAIWHLPVTREALRVELARMARGTRMPERLQELYAALGYDSTLIHECLVRPALVDRLIRNQLVSTNSGVRFEDWFSDVRAGLDTRRVTAVAADDDPLPSPGTASAAQAQTLCLPDDSWDNGSLDDNPLDRWGHAAVWTGTEMLVWGGALTGDRYDPASDTWSAMSTAGEPVARSKPVAVWTGAEMLVWGGTYMNTGGRYDPASDTWTSLSDLGAPTARYDHTAVWTGSEMIVWGGYDGSTTFNSGGRYNPATDTWTPTSMFGVPQQRGLHTAVWTGSRMVVWGGTPGGIGLATGGQYDPENDTWTPTSTLGAPIARGAHTAVWTGARMIVWGGLTADGPIATGGSYDPSGDTWTPISAAAEPSARWWHTAVYTGDSMIVWGGTDDPVNTTPTLTGGRYDPATDSWVPTSPLGAPAARFGHTAIWTGDRMIVFGGLADSDDPLALGTGGRYDPQSDTWDPTFHQFTPSARQGESIVWTGSEMIVWGGRAGTEDLDTGARYDAATDVWTPISTTGAPTSRREHTAVWTGERMIVWGGTKGGLGQTFWNSGGRYDPVTDIWAPMATLHAPIERSDHTAVWTGSQMIVWGGTYYSAILGTGGRYDPTIDAWLATATTAAPAPRLGHTAVWTGSKMIVWGGSSTGGLTKTGGVYDPVTNAWTATSPTGAPAPRKDHSAVWAGDRMIVWGGHVAVGETASGGSYDPVAQVWSPTSLVDAPAPRANHAAVWTGSEMIIWGGFEAEYASFIGTGARYDALADTWSATSEVGAPTGVLQPRAVWTGSLMLVWDASARRGGRYAMGHSIDGDGDGFSECAGDCDDADSSAFGMPPEVAGLRLLADKQTLVWNSAAPAAGTGTVHDIVRGALAGLPVGSGAAEFCVASGVSGSMVADLNIGAAGGSWYLVRARNSCGTGSYGQTSEGVERASNACP